jgi:hypothetical protein
MVAWYISTYNGRGPGTILARWARSDILLVWSWTLCSFSPHAGVFPDDVSSYGAQQMLMEDIFG